MEKPMVGLAIRIIDLRRSQVLFGRFLKKNATTGFWNDVGDKKALEKRSQALLYAVRRLEAEKKRKRETATLTTVESKYQKIHAAKAVEAAASTTANNERKEREMTEKITTAITIEREKISTILEGEKEKKQPLSASTISVYQHREIKFKRCQSGRMKSRQLN